MEPHVPGRIGRLALRFCSEQSFVYRLLFGPDPHRVRPKVLALTVFLVAVNVGVWVAAAIVYTPYPSMLGTGALAYTLGLRHAVDADHISAIDNVTRKLLNDNQRPVSVGLFFSLGHSTIVFITALIVAATANAAANGLENFSEIGGVIGTSVSIVFLTLIATLNIIVLVGVLKTLRRVKREGVYTELDIEEYMNSRGILGRFFRPVFRFVNASWKMYPLGLLFGIGFDTSTEITLLGITAVQGANGMNMWLIILLPLLFASGMALIDSLDGMLMLFTYTWAYVNPVRKMYYNLIITSISVVVACLVALIELFALIGEQLELDNGWWEFWYTLADSFEWIGIVIVGAFIVTWLVSAVVYRLLGYKDLEREFDEHKPQQDQKGVIAAEEGMASVETRAESSKPAEVFGSQDSEIINAVPEIDSKQNCLKEQL
ncbi:high-affinity nickel-transport protein-domain-containing protein [Phycomyces nitens]|nr:high-affinity nickel-transport protein-domain-containing protein [Phycomyces nitens]